jgi:tRNA nucleotidyltransferase (CCA-adding enzyme)
MERCDAFRKPGRFMDLLDAAGCSVSVDRDAWVGRLAAVRGVDAGAIARSVAGKPELIKAALREARLAALVSSCVPEQK